MSFKSFAINFVETNMGWRSKYYIKSLHHLCTTERIAIDTAVNEINNLECSNEEKEFLLEDFKRTYYKRRMRFVEYYNMYRFFERDESSREQFISYRDLEIIIRKYVDKNPNQRFVYSNKDVFLKTFSSYIKREWIVFDGTNCEEAEAFLQNYDVIVKPTNDCSGHGVRKFEKGKATVEQLKTIYGNKFLAEECIENCEELKRFHPSSLNTIRVITISDGNKVKTLCASLRTGNNNSVFDNADSGGVFAEIDASSGIVVSDGVDKQGNVYERHPYSNVIIKNTVIPRWSEIVEICESASLLMDTFISAWDIAVTDSGVEIIEGNTSPSIEINQSPLQQGIKRKLFEAFDDMHFDYRDCLRVLKLYERFHNELKHFALRY